MAFALPLLEGGEMPFVWISSTGFGPEDFLAMGAGKGGRVDPDADAEVEEDAGWVSAGGTCD